MGNRTLAVLLLLFSVSAVILSTLFFTATATPATILFSSNGQLLGDTASYDIAHGDFDGDGDQDAVIATLDIGGRIWVNQGSLQEGTAGQFASGPFIAEFALNVVDVADIDNDNDLDIVAGSTPNGETGPVYFIINNGGIQEGVAGTFAPPSVGVPITGTTDIAFADIDGDLDLDMFITRGNQGADQVWINQGGDQGGMLGQFNDSGQRLGLGSSSSVTLANLDDNQSVDAFITTAGGANLVWFNDGTGQFDDSGQLLGNANSRQSAAADFDGDGDIDVFTANEDLNRLWLNQGGTQGGSQGTFVASEAFLSEFDSRDIKAADIDQDGDFDAFVAEGGGTNTLWINQGGNQGGTEGLFAQHNQLFDNEITQALALADLNGDTSVDVFFANFTGPDTVYFNLSSTTGEPTPPPTLMPDWQSEIVVERGRYTEHQAITVDNLDQPTIAYVADVNNPVITIASWDGSSWRSQIIPDENLFIGPLSMAIDSQNEYHVVYAATLSNSDGPNRLKPAIKYARTIQGVWSIETISIDEVDAASEVDLELDSNDSPHIAFIRKASLINEPYNLTYATLDGSSWISETVATSPGGMELNGIALELTSFNRPQMIYTTDSFARRLFMAVRVSADFWAPTIIRTIDNSANPDFKIGITDEPYITYVSRDQTTNELDVYFGAQAFDDSWVWQEAGAFPLPSSIEYTDISLQLGRFDVPSIVFSTIPGSPSFDEENISPFLATLTLNGVIWENSRLIENNVGAITQAAIDSADQLHITYSSQPYSDIWYATFGDAWHETVIAEGGNHTALDLNAQPTDISVSHWSSNTLNITTRSTTWSQTGLTTTAAISATTLTDDHRIAYYDPQVQAIVVASQVSTDTQRVINHQENPYGYLDQRAILNEIAISYLDTIDNRLKLAIVPQSTESPVVYTNDQGPNIPLANGQLAMTRHDATTLSGSYFDATNGSLRYWKWNAQTQFWEDELVDSGDGAEVGRLNDIATASNPEPTPIIVYFDDTNNDIKVATRASQGWDTIVAVPDAGEVTDLAFTLLYDGDIEAIRIVYSVEGDSSLRMAQKLNETDWLVYTIAPVSDIRELAFDLRGQYHLVYNDPARGLIYARGAERSFAFNPFNPCQIGFVTRSPQENPAFSTNQQTASTPLSDQGIFERMTPFFETSTAGQHYISLYNQHAGEMGYIATKNLDLAWDGFGTLQNFLPGLEALVLGQGNQITVTQQMVDDAVAVWTRMSDLASPELAATINSELAAYNQLQDFVGLTFSEWFTALTINDVILPEDRLRLPLVTVSD